MESLPSLGDTIQTDTKDHQGLRGIVRYVGSVQGTTGDWIGVELAQPLGKNNGTVGTTTYFVCQANHGIFVRPAQIRQVEQAKKKTVQSKNPEILEENKTRAQQRLAAKKQEINKRISERKQQGGIEDEEARPSGRPSINTTRPSESSDPAILRSTISQKDSQIKKLTNDLNEAKQEIKQLQSSQNQVNELKQQVKKLKSQLQESGKGELDQETQDLIEKLTLDKEIAEENLEILQKELEELKLEHEELKEEMELKTLEMEELDEDADEINVDDLKSTLRKLYSDYQQTKLYYEERVQELENQVSQLPQMQSKLDGISELRLVIEEKDLQIEQLQESLDLSAGYQDMIEELTQDNIDLNEKIQAMQEQINELQELHELDEQYAVDQAELEKELNNDLHNKDVEISQLLNQIAELEKQKEDYENVITQFRAKVNQQQSEIGLIRDELNTTHQDDQQSRIKDLIEKNIQLSNKVRGLRGDLINSKISQINAAQSDKKSQYLINIIPNELVEQLDLSSFNFITMLKAVQQRSVLLFNQVIERSLEIQSEREQLRWMFQLCSSCITLTITVSSLQSFIQNLPLDKYQEIMKCQEWGNLLSASQALDYFLKLVKDEGISSSLSLDTLKFPIDALQAFRQEYIEEQEERLQLARSVMFTELGILALINLYQLDYSITGGVNIDELMRKGDYIVNSLLLIYVNEQSMTHHTTNLNNQFTYVAQVLEETDSNLSSYSWDEWFKAINRELKLIGNLQVLKQEPQEKGGPWDQIASDIHQKLNQFESTLNELNQQKEIIREWKIKYLNLESKVNESERQKKQLEERLTDANAKQIRLQQLEIDHKSLQNKNKYYQENLENAQLTLEQLQSKVKELEEENEKAKQLEQPAQQGNRSIMPNESGGGINTGRGGKLLSYGNTQMSSEEAEIYKGIIDRVYEESKLQKQSYLRLISNIPPYKQKKSRLGDQLSKFYSIRSQLNMDISTMQIVNTKDKSAKSQHVQQMQKVQFQVEQGRKLLESMTLQVNAQNHIYGQGLSAGFPNSKPVKYGKITFPNIQSGEKSVNLTIKELKSVQKLLKV